MPKVISPAIEPMVNSVMIKENFRHRLKDDALCLQDVISICGVNSSDRDLLSFSSECFGLHKGQSLFEEGLSLAASRAMGVRDPNDEDIMLLFNGFPVCWGEE